MFNPHRDVTMDQDAFREQLLLVMERKEHWAWPSFTHGKVPKRLLHIHLEQEYATYVRDFPRFVGYAYAQCEVPSVRRALAENLYEEETGGLVAKKPHPELFLQYPRGLGMDLERFEHVQLLPGAQRYRAWIDEAVQQNGWEVAAAVVTLFIEGTACERSEVDPKVPKKPPTPLHEHPLVKYYGLSLEDMALTKAHRQVEGDHRQAAWDSILNHVQAPRRAAVVSAMQRTVERWHAYRDDVALACGLRREAA